MKQHHIQISVPEKIYYSLETISQDKNTFILEAIESKIKESDVKNLEKQLIEGYKASQHETIEITKDFESIDFDGWEEY